MQYAIKLHIKVENMFYNSRIRLSDLPMYQFLLLFVSCLVSRCLFPSITVVSALASTFLALVLPRKCPLDRSTVVRVSVHQLNTRYLGDKYNHTFQLKHMHVVSM